MYPPHLIPERAPLASFSATADIEKGVGRQQGVVVKGVVRHAFQDVGPAARMVYSGSTGCCTAARWGAWIVHEACCNSILNGVPWCKTHWNPQVTLVAMPRQHLAGPVS